MMMEEIAELADLSELSSRYRLYLEASLLACGFLASQDLLVIHQLLSLLQEEEDRLQQQQQQQQQQKQQQQSAGSPPAESKTPEEASPRDMFSLMGLLNGNFLLSTPSPKPVEDAAVAHEDDEFAVKMLVLAIALVAAGEPVNVAMVSRSLELLLVHGSHSAMEMVLLAFSLLHVSDGSIPIVDQMMRKTAGGGQTNVGAGRGRDG